MYLTLYIKRGDIHPPKSSKKEFKTQGDERRETGRNRIESPSLLKQKQKEYYLEKETGVKDGITDSSYNSQNTTQESFCIQEK